MSRGHRSRVVRPRPLAGPVLFSIVSATLVIGLVKAVHAAANTVSASNVGQIGLAGSPTIDTAASEALHTDPLNLVVFFAAPGGGSTGITGYEYTTDGGSTWSPPAPMTSPLTIDAATSGGALTPDTPYSIVIAAVTSTGRGLPSNIWTVTTPA